MFYSGSLKIRSGQGGGLRIDFMGNQSAARGLEAQADPEGRIAVGGADLHDILGIDGLGEDPQQISPCNIATLAIQGPRFISSSTLKIFFSASFLGKGRFSREDAKSFPQARFLKFIIPDHPPGRNGIAASDRAIPKTKIAKNFNMFIFPVPPLSLGSANLSIGWGAFEIDAMVSGLTPV